MNTTLQFGLSLTRLMSIVPASGPWHMTFICSTANSRHLTWSTVHCRFFIAFYLLAFSRLHSQSLPIVLMGGPWLTDSKYRVKGVQRFSYLHFQLTVQFALPNCLQDPFESTAVASWRKFYLARSR